MKTITIGIQEIKNGLLVSASKYDSDYGYGDYDASYNQQTYAANAQEASVVVQSALTELLTA